MTVICSGGASASKPGFNETIVTSAAAVEGALTLFGLEVVAAILAPLLAGEVYDLTNFCTIDPPTTPTLTAGDMIDILNFADPTVFVPALAKFRQWFNSWYWFQVCQCTTTTTPAAPTLTAPSIGQNTGLPTGATAVPCWDVTQNEVQDLSLSPRFNVRTDLLPKTSDATVTPTFTGGPTTAQTIPIGVSNFQSTITRQSSPASGLSWVLNTFDSTGTVVGACNLFSSSNPVGTVFTQTCAIPSSAASWYIDTTWGAGNSGTCEDTAEVSFFCGGQTPTDIITPCCPPDPILEFKLNQILGIVQAILAGLPATVTASHDGTVHAGLSGNGRISLAAAPFAIRVDITTDPTPLSVEVGDVNFLPARGSIVPLIGTSAVRDSVRLVYSSQIYFLPELTETISFTLHPGVVVTITELLPGP